MKGLPNSLFVIVKKNTIGKYCAVTYLKNLLDFLTMTVFNASAAATLLEQRPEKIQVLSGINAKINFTV